MASIVKRKNKWAVVYTVEDDNGNKRQKWETFGNNADAKKRKAQVEHQLAEGTFIVPSATTLHDLLNEYISVYGINKWAASTYDSKRALLDNYVIPIIGEVKLDDINPRMMNRYYQSLLKVKSRENKYHKAKDAFVTPRTVEEIHKILRNAFNQAVKWELMSRNPVLNCTLPETEEKVREIWDVNTLIRATELCEDEILALAINLAFCCSLRMGELVGLTWDCVDISEEAIAENRAYIFVNKQLQRISKEAYAALDGKGVMYTFPAILANNRTLLVLKTPKTKTSTRKVFLPKTVAEMLIKRKQQLEEYKSFFGSDYTDYNLVFCNEVGRPTEGKRINSALAELIEKNGLPKVCFHSIRHTSTTYKLKLTGGDIKAVQGDTGHNTAQMVTERYAHILDDDRRVNAVRFEQAFYEKRETEPTAAVSTPTSTPAADGDGSEKEELFELLSQSPEMMALLRSMLSKKK